jgi:hypothetical protein
MIRPATRSHTLPIRPIGTHEPITRPTFPSHATALMQPLAGHRFVPAPDDVPAPIIDAAHGQQSIEALLHRLGIADLGALVDPTA